MKQLPFMLTNCLNQTTAPTQDPMVPKRLQLNVNAVCCNSFLRSRSMVKLEVRRNNTQSFKDSVFGGFAFGCTIVLRGSFEILSNPDDDLCAVPGPHVLLGVLRFTQIIQRKSVVYDLIDDAEARIPQGHLSGPFYEGGWAPVGWSTLRTMGVHECRNT